MHVWMYVKLYMYCMYVCTECMYTCLYLCTVCMYVYIYICLFPLALIYLLLYCYLSVASSKWHRFLYHQVNYTESWVAKT